MKITNKCFKPLYLIILFALFLTPAPAQKKKSKKQIPAGKQVMWEKVNISRMDTFYGPGGKAMQPDLSRIEFIKEEKGGHNKKYRIKDGKGRVWVAKLGREARPETAAVRLLWSLGYKTEINYLVPQLTIPGKGTFQNVRLEARPENIDRLGNWSWRKNPFMGTNEFQGLKILMVLIHNWDIVDVNNTLLGEMLSDGNRIYYTVGDLGSTFGRLGNNNLPVIYRLGRTTGRPKQFAKSILVREVEDGKIELSYKGKLRDIFNNITVRQGRWLADLLLQLEDKQIEDAFRAANYSAGDIDIFKRAIKAKIEELDNATTQNLALR